MSKIVEMKMAQRGLAMNQYGDIPIDIGYEIIAEAAKGADPMIMTLANTKRPWQMFTQTCGVTGYSPVFGHFLKGVDPDRLADPIGRFDGVVTFAKPEAWHKNWCGRWIHGVRAAWSDARKTIWIYDADGDVIDIITPEDRTIEEGWRPYAKVKELYVARAHP